MYSILEAVFLSKELHQSLFSPLCDKYDLTYAEMIVLLYVSVHPENNTATDVVINRRLTKSAVSMAVHSLANRNLIHGFYEDGNHRSVHLKLCDGALKIIDEASVIQKKYIGIITNGFNESELETMGSDFKRISENVKNFRVDDKPYGKKNKKGGEA